MSTRKKTYPQVALIRLPEGTLERADAILARRGKFDATRAAVLRAALLDGLAKLEKEK